MSLTDLIDNKNTPFIQHSNLNIQNEKGINPNEILMVAQQIALKEGSLSSDVFNSINLNKPKPNFENNKQKIKLYNLIEKEAIKEGIPVNELIKELEQFSKLNELKLKPSNDLINSIKIDQRDIEMPNQLKVKNDNIDPEQMLLMAQQLAQQEGKLASDIFNEQDPSTELYVLVKLNADNKGVPVSELMRELELVAKNNELKPEIANDIEFDSPKLEMPNNVNVKNNESNQEEILDYANQLAYKQGQQPSELLNEIKALVDPDIDYKEYKEQNNDMNENDGINNKGLFKLIATSAAKVGVQPEELIEELRQMAQEMESKPKNLNLFELDKNEPETPLFGQKPNMNNNVKSKNTMRPSFKQ